MSSNRRARVAGLTVALSALLTGCGFHGASSLPLPGGADTGLTYQVSVILDDASDLVAQDGVRVNDVAVGAITSISLTPDLRARVVCRIRTSVHLPANAIATLEQTSLLGEQFVALGPPTATPATGTLRDGAQISNGNTSNDPNVEQVLGALSAILNGGSVGQLQVISRELTSALTGRQTDVRSLLTKMSALVGTLNTHRGDLVAALDELDRLSTTLAAQHQQLAAALDGLPAGIAVLADERPKLTALVAKIGTLSTVATRVINESKDATIADLAQLNPVLAELSVNGNKIAEALQIGTTYPFANDALAGIKGDYSGFYPTLDFNADSLGQLLGSLAPHTSASRPNSAATPSAATISAPHTALLPALSTLLTQLPTALTNLLLGIGVK